MVVKPRAIINEILPYRPGKPIGEVQRELGLTTVVKLASNENSLGPSPKALAAIREALPEVFLYPEGSGHYLVKKLCDKHGLAFDQIILGNGANDLLELVVKTFAGPGDNVVSAHPSFIMYKIAAQIMEADYRATPLKDYRFDLDAMLAHADSRTRVFFIANPNNPTGTIITRGQLDRFLPAVPDGAVVVLDEAYCDFVEAADYPDSLADLKKGLNVMTMRSFSKNYGLAGLRVGWAAAHADVIGAMQRIRQPFNVNLLAQAAAVGALDDDEHLANSRRMVTDGRRQLYAGLDALGARYVKSEANFVLIELGRDAGPVYEGLLRLGVIVRPMPGWGYPQAIRVTVGTAAENAAFLDAFKKLQ